MNLVSFFRDRTRAIVEGYYCGDSSDSTGIPIVARIPNHVTRVNIGTEVLVLYSLEDGLADPCSGFLANIKPQGPINIRSLQTEDGRVYISPKLRNSDDCFLRGLSNFIDENGFDRAYKKMST